MENQTANDMVQPNWKPYEGVMVAYGVQPKSVLTYLRQLNVVSEVDWFEATPYLMGINVLANAEGMVASLKDGMVEYVPDITLGELVNKLAETFTADVRIGVFNSNKLPETVAVDESEIKSAESVRVVEITDLRLESIPFCAMFQNLNVAAFSLGSSKTVVCYEVPEAEFYPEMVISQTPVVKLWMDSKDEKILALKPGDTGELISRSHSWKMKTEIAAGAKDGLSAEVEKQIRFALGHEQSPSFIAEIAGCKESDLIDSFKKWGSQGFADGVLALGLSADVHEFLQGKLSLDEITGAVLFQGAGWIKAWQNSVDMQKEFSLKSGPLPLIRRFAGKYPILSTMLNTLEAVVGLGLIFYAGYNMRNSRGYPKLMIFGGLSLLLDSALKGVLGNPLRVGESLKVAKNSHKNRD